MTRVLDPVKNFAEVIPTGTYTAASTTINLTTGTGGTLPDVTTEGAFNLVWFNSTDYTGPAIDPQKEIVRVVARTSDILTVLRGQEGTTASTKAIAGKVYKMTLAVTEHIIDQVNTQLELDKTMSDVLTASGLIGNSGKFLTTDGLTISWSNVSGTGVSTFTNLGAGSGLVAAIVGVDLQVKSIIAGTNVTITSTATAITINATGGGGGGDVYLASNNAFTGNNTHAGSETFSGVVDLSGATITYPTATQVGGSNTYSATTTQTYAASSTNTYANESVISNQADETFGAGYEGVYQSGSSIDFQAGSLVDFTGATVTGLPSASLPTTTVSDILLGTSCNKYIQVSSTLFYLRDEGTQRMLKLDSGVLTVLVSMTGYTTGGGRLVLDSSGNIFSDEIFGGNGRIVKITSAGVLTDFASYVAASRTISGIDKVDNIYAQTNAGGMNKITPAAVETSLTVPGTFATNTIVYVIGYDNTESFVTGSHTSAVSINIGKINNTTGTITVLQANVGNGAGTASPQLTNTGTIIVGGGTKILEMNISGTLTNHDFGGTITNIAKTLSGKYYINSSNGLYTVDSTGVNISYVSFPQAQLSLVSFNASQARNIDTITYKSTSNKIITL